MDVFGGSALLVFVASIPRRPSQVARSTVRDSLHSSCLPSPADNNEPPYKKNRPLDKAIKSCSQPLPYSLDLIVIKK